MLRRLAALAPLLLSTLGLASPAFAGPWLPEARSGSIALNYSHTRGDQYWLGEREFNLPGELRYNTTTLRLSIGATNWLAFDGSIGHQRRSFESSRPLLIRSSSDSGSTDPSVGMRLLLLDEFKFDYLPTVSARIGGVFSDDDDANSFGSTDKGSNALELSLDVGRFLTDTISVNASVGTLRRSSDLPREMTYSVGASYAVIKDVSVYLDYRWLRTSGNQDVALGAGLAQRYAQRKIEEDVLGAGFSVGLGKHVDLNLGYERTLQGRNTLRGDTFSAGLAVSF